MPAKRGRTNYRIGYVFECKVRNLYRASGWFVQRSAGSKTVVDLTAIPPEGGCGGVHLIQCKLTGKLSAKEWNELVSLAWRVGMDMATPVLAAEVKGVRRRAELVLFHLVGKASDSTRPMVQFEL